MRAGLIQEVTIETSQAVSELPTWMGYAARWRVRCVSLAEANDILAGCKRLEKEQEARMLAFPRMACLSAPVHQSLSQCHSVPAAGSFANP